MRSLLVCLLLAGCVPAPQDIYIYEATPPACQAAPEPSEEPWPHAICKVPDNRDISFYENCLQRYAPNGLPCKVCQGYENCESPIGDKYCVDFQLGCQDPTCVAR